MSFFRSFDYDLAAHKTCELSVVVSGASGEWKCDAYVFAQATGLGASTCWSAVQIYKYLGLSTWQAQLM